VFLTDMDNLAAYRETRNRFFASVTPPAAPAVSWSRSRNSMALIS